MTTIDPSTTVSSATTNSIPGTPSAASASADQAQIIGPVHFTSENPTIPTAFQFLLERAHARERYTRPEWWDVLKRYTQNLTTLPTPSGPSLPSSNSSAALPAGGTPGQVLTRTADGWAWLDMESTNTGGTANFFTNTKTLELDTVDHPNYGTGLGGTLQTGGKIVRLGFVSVSIPTPALAT